LPRFLVAQRADGSGIDITSKSNPDGAPRVWWNLGNQTFAWKPGGAPLPTPLVWTGSDGDVRFLPKVVAAS
jgi:hypothetical protein